MDNLPYKRLCLIYLKIKSNLLEIFREGFQKFIISLCAKEKG